MDFLFNLLVSGLVVGGVYGLIAMGFAVIYRATGMLNFAQGELMMLAAYIAYALATWMPAGPQGPDAGALWLVVPGTLAAAMVAAVLLEALFIRPMAGESMFAKVMVTIALAVMIRAGIVLAWGNEPQLMPRLLGNALIRLGPVALYTPQVVVLLALALTSAATWALFARSRAGLAMRATANDESAALLMGIDVRRVYTLAWALAALYAGLAGLACAFLFSVDPTVYSLGLRSFPATILGGLDSVLGGALGGLVIGVLENLAGGYLGRGMKDIVGFLLIIVVLMVKPYGLFGTRRIERV
ncbi:MAG TPA: branched-chain amino acid ABC transporter permease [Rubrivivax sp.]|nr:branched-chain amino acid ABC transporter permease [Rubrivivax sp.]